MSHFRMLVELPVKADSMPQVLDLLKALMPRLRAEDGCLAFDVYASAESNAAWIYEEYVTEAYHDDVHESYAETKNVLQRLPEYLSGPWTVHKLDATLSR